MSVTLYGIPNCDTVRKARAWLDARGIAYAFHDYRKTGSDPAKLAVWCAIAGWDKVLNRAGTTFRKIAEAQRENLDETTAIALMLAHPSCIKRPIVEYPGGLLVGFKEADWEVVLA
jgi:Spx/MgsR family transcriptional regulator